jgi:hypothetical protein
MSDPPVKGRRAADRRRERSEDDQGPAPPVESTLPGQKSPGVMEDGGEGDATATRIPAEQRRNKTSVTALTSVGTAAKDIMRQDPLEATKVRQLDLRPALPAGRLICLEGKDVGKSFELTHSQMTVGRSQDAHIRVNDNAVNRFAFEIVYDPETAQFTFNSMANEPAPLLNGEEAAGQRELSDGDVVEVGETTLRFVRVSGAAPVEREQPKPKEATVVKAVPEEPGLVERTRVMILRARDNARVMKRLLGGLVVLAVLLAVGGVFGWQAYQRASREAALNDPKGSYQTLLRQARAQRDSRRWNELADTARAVEAQAADRDDGPRLKEEARAEQQAERNLALGRMSHANGQHDAARSALRLIPDTSVYKADRDETLERVNEIGRNASLAVIRELLSQGRYKEAAEKAEQHLSTYAGDSEVTALRGQAVRNQLARESQGSGSWQATRQKALQALEVSDFTQALLLVQAATETSDKALASTFLNRLKSMLADWKTGRDLLSRKDARAVEPLQRAKAAEAELSGGKGALSRDIAKALADALYLQGVELLQKNRDCDARVSFERANLERGSDPKVVDKLSRLAQKGREILDRAEAARSRGDKAEATRLARDAACRLPKGQEDRARADKLAGGKG